MKKAVIITPNDNYGYDVRIKYVEKWLCERGYSVIVISSDFDHRRKAVYSIKRDNLELLHVPPYKRNLSFSRIYSHIVFSKKVYKKLKTIKPDLVYCSAPPNFLYRYVARYKRKRANLSLIFEIGDLWPETLPFGSKAKKMLFPAIKIWASLRDKNLRYADAIIYECRFFMEKLSKNKTPAINKVIYLIKDDFYKNAFNKTDNGSSSILRFAYVGSINNIIDIDLIVDIVKQVGLHRKTQLVLIGGGENEQKLIDKCIDSNIDFENYGIVYDEEKKHEILSRCQFGMNIMKKSVAVGLTMKSLEYFHEGLILVNNIPHDSAEIVKKYNCGFNIFDFSEVNNLSNLISHLSIQDIENLRNNSRIAYSELFSEESAKKSFLDLLDRLKDS